MFEAPPYAVRGAKKYDQAWIDETIESGVGGCNWQRPKPRPAALDASGDAAPAKPRKKPGIVQRIKDKVWPTAAAPISPLMPAAAQSPAMSPPDPLEDLLGK